MSIGTEKFRELERTFVLVADATERLLGEYALFVLEHEEVVTFLRNHLRSLSCSFECALYRSNYAQAKHTLEEVQMLFGEAQLKVNRSVILSPAQMGDVTHSKTDI